MRDSNVANAAKESAQAKFPHGLLEFLHVRAGQGRDRQRLLEFIPPARSLAIAIVTAVDRQRWLIGQMIPEISFEYHSASGFNILYGIY
jgi:hypothetical protein